MFRKIIFVMIGVVLSLMVAVPALAVAPAEGVVVEGQSVPGVALGDSRAQVEAAYGRPESCRNMSYYDGRQGIDGICRFDVEGGGRVTMYYFDANGDPAQGSPDDEVFIIRWSQAVSGWVTTAGVNTTLALADPDAVIAAYPNAVVTYNSVFGNIVRIEDRPLGIVVNYSFDYLSGTLSVDMVIRFPSDPLPVPEKETHVTDIDLTAAKVKGNRQLRALVRVEDEQGSSARDATVSGYAYFEILDAPRGLLTLRVDDVVLEGYQFDRANSVLSASTRVK
jgi:hypothetical protein